MDEHHCSTSLLPNFEVSPMASVMIHAILLGFFSVKHLTTCDNHCKNKIGSAYGISIQHFAPRAFLAVPCRCGSACLHAGRRLDDPLSQPRTLLQGAPTGPGWTLPAWQRHPRRHRKAATRSKSFSFPAWSGDCGAVRALLEAGASPLAVEDGVSIVEYARRHAASDELLELLERPGRLY